MDIVVTNEKKSKRRHGFFTRFRHKLKKLFGQKKTAKQKEIDKHQSRKNYHYEKQSIFVLGIPCLKIKKSSGDVIEERFTDAPVQEDTPVQEKSCNSATLSYNSEYQTQCEHVPPEIATKSSVDITRAYAQSYHHSNYSLFHSKNSSDHSLKHKTPSVFSDNKCSNRSVNATAEISPVEVCDLSKKNKACFPYVKNSTEIDALPFPDTFNCKDPNKIYQTKEAVEKIAPAPSIKTFPSLERTEDSHEDETSLKSTHTYSQRLGMDSMMSQRVTDSTPCTLYSNEHSLTYLKTVYKHAVVTSDGHQNMSFDEIDPGKEQFEEIHQMQSVNHLKDVIDCEDEICTELDCLSMKELSSSYPDSTTKTSDGYFKSSEISDGLASTSNISDTSNGNVYESIPDTSNNSDAESTNVKCLQNDTLNHIHDMTGTAFCLFPHSDDQENSNSKAVEENCGTIESTNPDVKQEISKETSSDPSSDIQIDNSEHIFPLSSNNVIMYQNFYYMRVFEEYEVLDEPIEHSSLIENSTTDFSIQTLIRAESSPGILVYYMLLLMNRLHISEVYNNNVDENLIIPFRNQSELSVTDIEVESLKQISSKVDNYDTFRDPRGMLNIAVKDGKCSEKQQSVDLSETLSLCCLFQYCIMVLLITLHKDKLGEGIDKEEENTSIVNATYKDGGNEDVLNKAVLLYQNDPGCPAHIMEKENSCMVESILLKEEAKEENINSRSNKLVEEEWNVRLSKSVVTEHTSPLVELDNHKNFESVHVLGNTSPAVPINENTIDVLNEVKTKEDVDETDAVHASSVIPESSPSYEGMCNKLVTTDEHKLSDLDLRKAVIIGSTKRLAKHICSSKTKHQVESQKVMLPDTGNIRNHSFKVHSEYKKNSFGSNGSSTSSWNERVKDKRRKRKRKCKRLKENTCNLKPENKSINNSNHVNNINMKCIKEDSQNQKEKSFTKGFCHKCHQHKSKANICCSECRSELNSIKYQCRVRSREDSGIASCLSSIRSSILSEFDQLQPSHSTKQNSETRKRSLRKLLKLGLLEQDLRRITKQVNNEVFANTEHDGVVWPGLQSYFDSLRNGITPSLQERMVYEWLRLMSFSSYTGGGSPVHLARSGFYLHHGNETHCYSCDASYSTWSYTDNVDEIHRRISPNCPYINGGLASSGNISIESGRQDNQSSQSNQNSGRQENLSSQSTQSQARSQLPHHGRDTTNQPAPEGLFSFRPNTGTFQGGIPTSTASTTNISPAFSFYPSSTVNSPPGFSFSQLPSASSQPTGRIYSSAEVTNQLGALTIQQQSSGIQQPTEEPQSRNPFIVPTQPLQTPAHIRGGAQLTVSDHQTPEGRQQNNTGNQPIFTGASSSGSSERVTGSSATSTSSSEGSAERPEKADTIPLIGLKYPNYSTMAVRMSSFASWPPYLRQTARQMAYAGFFHPGVADFARCFCCGGGLRNWEADDDPMVEHARWYPRCEYINQLKGNQFVQAVLRRHREQMQGHQPHQLPPFQMSQRQGSSQDTFATPDPMTTDVAASLLEMGFTQERAREAILTVRRLKRRSEVTAEEVTAWMLDDETAPRTQPGLPPAVASSSSDHVRREQDPETSTAASTNVSSSGSSETTSQAQGSPSGSTGSLSEIQGATGSSVKPKDEGKEKDKKSRSRKSKSARDKKSKSANGNSSKENKDNLERKEVSETENEDPVMSEGASLLPLKESEIKSLKEENKMLKQQQVCKICMDQYTSVTFLPCGHLVCCEGCAKSMRKCPICRKRIKGQVRTYVS